MTLDNLPGLTGLSLAASIRSLNVTALTIDSRCCEPGTLFLAMPGYTVDGRDYIDAALRAGATAVLSHSDQQEQHGQLSVEHDQAQPVIHYYRLRQQLGQIAAHFYGEPGSALKLIGITGTNGKTSTSQICAELLHHLGERCGVLGTLGNGLYGQLTDSRNTTPDALAVQRTLAQVRDAGASACAMEVSSHALVQQRTAGCPFDVAVFTNLSRDHLDYHGDMQRYAAAKRELFLTPDLKGAVINADDAVGRQWLSDSGITARKIAFSLDPDALPADVLGEGIALVSVSEIAYHADGCRARLHTFAGDAVLSSPLLGAFNLQNLLAALAALLVAGYPLEELVAACRHLTPASGRMETISSPQQPLVVVDYAHTPDALHQALGALRAHCEGRLWCLFGCGGDRDQGKRPQMAAAAEQMADEVIVTSDNPRSEQPQAIIDQICQGFTTAPRAVISDRDEAIRYAVSHAGAQDVILLAGKGHEAYQEVAGGRRLPYSETATAHQALAQWSAENS